MNEEEPRPAELDEESTGEPEQSTYQNRSTVFPHLGLNCKCRAPIHHHHDTTPPLDEDGEETEE